MNSDIVSLEARGMTMKATLKSQESYAKYALDRKELVRVINVAVIESGKIVVPITAKFYMGRSRDAMTVHCNLWAIDRSGERRTSGYGAAGGGGYHKESAALAAAIRSAGIYLSERIDGVGEMAMQDALTAIVRELGYTGNVRMIG